MDVPRASTKTAENANLEREVPDCYHQVHEELQTMHCLPCHKFLGQGCVLHVLWAQGWLLVPKAPQPSGPAMSTFAVFFEQPVASSVPEASQRSGRPIAPAPGVAKELAAMTLAELKQVLTKVNNL